MVDGLFLLPFQLLLEAEVAPLVWVCLMDATVMQKPNLFRWVPGRSMEFQVEELAVLSVKGRTVVEPHGLDLDGAQGM